MKFKSPFKILASMAIFSLSVAFAQAYTLYEDNFSGAAGSIVNTGTPSSSRQPNVINWDANRYQGANNQPSINGSGLAYSTNGGGAVSLALPSFTSGDVITITLQMTTVMTNPAGWLMTGFTSGANTFGSIGVLSSGLSGNGRFRAGTGTSNSNLAITTTNDSAVTQSGTSPNITYSSVLTTYVMTYNTGTGALGVSFNNASMASAYNWNTVLGSPIALTDLKYATIQWNGAGTSTVDSFKVEVQAVVIPEAEVTAAAIIGALALLIIVRKRRQKVTAAHASALR